MNRDFDYKEYVNDDSFLKEYHKYQEKHLNEIRESDKVIIQKLSNYLSKKNQYEPKILDIGCSTGNLLFHLKNSIPSAVFVGGDMASSSIEQCKKNTALQDIEFEVMDILSLPDEAYDVIVVNAVLYMFDQDQYRKALYSIQRSLKPGGITIVFDFAHPFAHQDITINETSVLHPNGLRLCFRPMKKIKSFALSAGFESIDFIPFDLPIDLPKPSFDEEVVTYTVKSEDLKRMMFRGILYQPWCHMIITKAS